MGALLSVVGLYHEIPLQYVIVFQDRQEKQFIFHHSRSVFELLDADCSGNISAEEFESFGFLFNFDGGAIRQIFKEFDVSGDQVQRNSCMVHRTCSRTVCTV